MDSAENNCLLTFGLALPERSFFESQSLQQVAGEKQASTACERPAQVEVTGPTQFSVGKRAQLQKAVLVVGSKIHLALRDNKL